MKDKMYQRKEKTKELFKTERKIQTARAKKVGEGTVQLLLEPQESIDLTSPTLGPLSFEISRFWPKEQDYHKNQNNPLFIRIGIISFPIYPLSTKRTQILSQHFPVVFFSPSKSYDHILQLLLINQTLVL